MLLQEDELRETDSERGAGDRAPLRRETLETLRRVEAQVREIRSAIDVTLREREHHDFSPLALVGIIVQLIVIAILAIAWLDWAFGAADADPLTMLAFAGVLQLGALTAFIMSRDA
jgi:hypothetical protein